MSLKITKIIKNFQKKWHLTPTPKLHNVLIGRIKALKSKHINYTTEKPKIYTTRTPPKTKTKPKQKSKQNQTHTYIYKSKTKQKSKTY